METVTPFRFTRLKKSEDSANEVNETCNSDKRYNAPQRFVIVKAFYPLLHYF